MHSIHNLELIPISKEINYKGSEFGIFYTLIENQKYIVKKGDISLSYESYILSLIDSSYFPKVKYFFKEDDFHYLILQFKEGQTLKDLIGLDEDWISKKLPIAKSVEITIELANAMNKLHEEGILYRDLNLGHFIYNNMMKLPL